MRSLAHRGTTVLLLALLVSSGAASSFAIQGGEVPITLDLTFASQYIWRGFDTYDTGIDDDKFQPSFQPSINIDLWDSGFSLNVWGAFALQDRTDDDHELENFDELDYTVAWGRTFFEDEVYAVDFGANFIYYDFPHLGSESDYWEIGMGVAFPNLIPITEDMHLVPSYYVSYDDGVEDEEHGGIEDGWFHILGLSLDIPISPIVSSQEEQAISLFWDIQYVDDFAGYESDWTHTTVGVSTTFEWALGENVGLYVTPMLAYQFELDEGWNDEDEFYGALSVGLTF